MRGLIDRIQPHRVRMVGLAILSLLGASGEIGFILLVTSLAVAFLGGGENVSMVLGVSLDSSGAFALAGVLLVVRTLGNLGAVQVSAGLVASVTTYERDRLARSYLMTSWAVQQASQSGRLQELMTSFIKRTTETVATVAHGVTATISLLAFVIAGFVVDPLSAAAVVGGLALASLVLGPFRRGLRHRADRHAQADIQFAKGVAEVGGLGLEMKVFGVESAFIERLGLLIRDASNAQRRTNVLVNGLPHLYTSLLYAFMLGGLAIAFMMKASNPLALSSLVLLMLRSMSYGQQMMSSLATIAGNLPFIRSVDDAIQQYVMDRAPRGEARPKSVAPLCLNAIDFAYPGGEQVLSGVTISLARGEILGIIGPSGAGKSTIVQLLLGLRQPTGGVLRVGGVSMDLVDRDWLARKVAFVPQEPRLLAGSIGDNVRFMREGITLEKVAAACVVADLMDLVSELPDGLETFVGEEGGRLSGGQRQRVAIARAIAGDPEVLVLDEPTSALDPQSEIAIRAALDRLRGRMTIVLIAHRMSTVGICDRIAVIENGTISACERPGLLSEASDFYKRSLAASAEK